VHVLDPDVAAAAEPEVPAGREHRHARAIDPDAAAVVDDDDLVRLAGE
jgi:hypothetical protein